VSEKSGMSVARFRKTALALSDAIESSHFGKADFRVGKRIFATLGYPDEDWGTLKLTPEQQTMLVDAEPEIFRAVPGGWGRQGYTNVRLAKADATTLKSAMAMAWENVAPKPKVTKAKVAKPRAPAKPRTKAGKRVTKKT
jgi:hypothetical protein